MGCGMSKQSRDHRRIRNHKPVRYNWVEECKVDMEPMIVDGVLYVKLQPQDVVVGLGVTDNRNSVQFDLTSVLHCTRMKLRTELLAEQLLLPMISLAGLDPDSVIVEYKSGEERHVRMIDSQWEKRWIIEGKELTVFKNGGLGKKWSICVSSADRWMLSTE